MRSSLDLAIRAATETVLSHGITPDRCDILQHGHTLVLRLTETLVARVVTDREGPRQGLAWFARENAVAEHLTRHQAPVVPLHPDLPPGPHEHLGFALNFWQFVTAIPDPPSPAATGRTLFQCHRILRSFQDPLPRLAILTESLGMLEPRQCRNQFPGATVELLRHHLTASLELLETCPAQPLHGDAHPGNLLNTTSGLLWTDWEDTFSGPVEWDLASLVWNAKILEGDLITLNGILGSYQDAGGQFDETVLQQCLIARASVMSIWYPVLYPDPGPERQAKLQQRLAWLATQPAGAGWMGNGGN